MKNVLWSTFPFSYTLSNSKVSGVTVPCGFSVLLLSLRVTSGRTVPSATQPSRYGKSDITWVAGAAIDIYTKLPRASSYPE